MGSSTGAVTTDEEEGAFDASAEEDDSAFDSAFDSESEGAVGSELGEEGTALELLGGGVALLLEDGGALSDLLELDAVLLLLDDWLSDFGATGLLTLEDDEDATGVDFGAAPSIQAVRDSSNTADAITKHNFFMVSLLDVFAFSMMLSKSYFDFPGKFTGTPVFFPDDITRVHKFAAKKSQLWTSRSCDTHLSYSQKNLLTIFLKRSIL